MVSNGNLELKDLIIKFFCWILLFDWIVYVFGMFILGCILVNEVLR